MSRHNKAAERAAAEASEAARTLGQRSAEARREASVEPAPEPKPEIHVSEPGRVEKLLKGRPHTQAMDELLEKREKADPEPQEEPKAEEQPQPQPEPVTEPVAAPEAPQAPVMVKQKVDGEEFEVSQAEIDEAGGPTAWRLNKAAENRLKKHNEALAEIRRAQAELVEWTKKNQTPVQPQVSDQQFIAERMDKVRFGSPEEAAQAQLEINQRLNKPVDQNTLIQQAENQIEHNRAVREFDRTYNDLVRDPMLLSWVVAERAKRVAEIKGPVDWNNFYSTLGNDIRSRLGRQSQPVTTPTVTTPGNPSQPSEKEARKASITTLPTAAARAELPKEEKELTPDEERKAWIAEQKKARGLG